MDKKDNNHGADKIHDKLFRDVYSRPANAAGFLRGFLS